MGGAELGGGVEKEKEERKEYDAMGTGYGGRFFASGADRTEI